MKIIKVKDYNELSNLTSKMIIEEITKNPHFVLGLPTGKSPLGTYKNLIIEYKKGKVDFSNIRTFNLDEYYPVKKNDIKSYKYYMFKNLFDKINIKKENIHLLNGNTKNPIKECEDYEKKIRNNPIDLQIVGIGVNGHIGFNEPGSEKNSKTRLVELAPETVKRNKYLGKALTMGISTILKSKKIILLASGKEKAVAVKDLIIGDVDKNLPASFLKQSNNLTLIIDEEASSLL